MRIHITANKLNWLELDTIRTTVYSSALLPKLYLQIKLIRTRPNTDYTAQLCYPNYEYRYKLTWLDLDTIRTYGSALIPKLCIQAKLIRTRHSAAYTAQLSQITCNSTDAVTNLMMVTESESGQVKCRARFRNCRDMFSQITISAQWSDRNGRGRLEQRLSSINGWVQQTNGRDQQNGWTGKRLVSLTVELDNGLLQTVREMQFYPFTSKVNQGERRKTGYLVICGFGSTLK